VVLLLVLMKPFVLPTVIGIAAVAPAATGNVLAVVDNVKVSVEAVTVKLTGVEFDPLLPLVPVTVIDCAPVGSAMFAVVVMVKVRLADVVPLTVTLG
jgi:hypothetical protein